MAEILISPTFLFRAEVLHASTFRGTLSRSSSNLRGNGSHNLGLPCLSSLTTQTLPLSTLKHRCPPLFSSNVVIPLRISNGAAVSGQPRKKKKRSRRLLNQWPLFSSPRAAVTSALPFPGAIAFDSCAVERARGEWVAVGHSISRWQEMAALSSGTGCWEAPSR